MGFLSNGNTALREARSNEPRIMGKWKFVQVHITFFFSSLTLGVKGALVFVLKIYLNNFLGSKSDFFS